MIFAFLFFPLLSVAGVIQDDVATTDKLRFSFKTVCKKMVTDPYYLRAYIDKEKREVVCQSGKKVLFKYLCVTELI